MLLCLLIAGGSRADERPADSSGDRSSETKPSEETGLVETGFFEDGAYCLRFVHADSMEDGRAAEVRAFLEKHSCPIPDLAPDFVVAADLNELDYRLLPVLAVLESGCGRSTRNHNLFGWANGKKDFGSFRASIHHVAQRLRVAPHYAGKTLPQKLKIYNRRLRYRRKVLAMMDTMPSFEGPMDAPEAGGH